MRTHRAVVTGVGVVGAALLCVTALAARADDEGGGTSPVAPSAGSGWSQDLREDFATVDDRYWTLKDDDFSSNEDSFLRADNCTVDDAGADGHALRLQGKQETVRRWGQVWDYTSCSATTEGKYSVPNYFRAEVRARVPMEQGMWAAPLWFRPSDGSGGEIDLVETLGRQADSPRVIHSIHTDYGSAHESASFDYPFARLGDPDGTGWHTYTIEKVPGRLTMWVDGVQTAEWSVDDPHWYAEYYEAGKRWDLRINLQIGGDWSGAPDSSTDWSPDRTALLVDHVYVWKPSSPLSLVRG